MSDSRQKGKYVHKYILVGNIAVGKTVAAKSFAEGKPNITSQYKMTIGVDYAMRDVTIGDSTASIQIWDIAGEQRFGTMTKTYFRGANAVIIMFDLTNMVSWEDVDVWRQDVFGKLGLESNSNRIPVLIVGNKLDLTSPERPAVVTDDALQDYVQKHGLWKGIKASVRTDNTFTDSILELAQLVQSSFPTKFVADSETLESKQPLNVLPPTSAKSSLKDSKNRRSLVSSSDRQQVSSASNSPTTSRSSSSNQNYHKSDDDSVYTHTEDPENESEKTSCCKIS